TCAGAIIERLVHRADVVRIRGMSWRLKEARERAGAIDPEDVSHAADESLTPVDDDQEDA
ncbi:MAG: hypothetical protein H6700_08535, partial [Myxococcales bacterium]|nr:hypothetical protein [Myxococcales bacterium]